LGAIFLHIVAMETIISHYLAGLVTDTSSFKQRGM